MVSATVRHQRVAAASDGASLAQKLTKKDVAAFRAHVKLERFARAARDAEEVRKLGAGFPGSQVCAWRLDGLADEKNR